MTPPQAMAARLNTRVARILRSSIRVILAVVVLVAVCLAWLMLFLLFAPFLLVAELVRLFRENRTTIDLPEVVSVAASSRSGETEESVPLIFDRRNDVSKLYGCNTRNVRYRWTLFETCLDLLQREFENPTALDFGAGSLRDSYELALRGFKVISFDLNEGILNRYFEFYDWNRARMAPTLASGSLDDLVNLNPANSVELIIAFDVIEHLPDPESYVRVFKTILSERGFLFMIVPNRRSLFERYFKHSFAQATRKGLKADPGVPHVQFKSPEEWEEFFRTNGFNIVAHEMTIGHLVNDWWNGLLAIPLRTFVYPVLDVLAFRLGRQLDAGRLERAFCPAWLMERVSLLDAALKRWCKPRFGWNLLIAQKQP